MHKYFPYLFTLLLLASCGKSGKKDDDRSVFRMNLPAGLPTLDPAYASDQASIWMCAQLYDGLVQFDRDLEIRPALAQSWTLEDSGRTYRFHLRSDAFFHPHSAFSDGQPRRLKASDVAYSFTRICNPEIAAKGFWIFNGKVRGLAAFRSGEANSISGFEAANDSTFLIHLDQAFPPFLSTLAMAYGYVIPPEVAEEFGKDFRSHPVGTGPFRFKSWNEGASLVLLRNDRYHERDASGQSLPYLDAVQVRFIREKLTEFREFLQGKLDFVNGLDKSTKDEIFLPDGSIKPEYGDHYDFRIAPQLNTEFIGINVDPTTPAVSGHPLADVRVRQALNYALDREKLVRHLLNGIGFPAHSGMVPPGMPAFDSLAVQGYRYDPDRAAQLLREAGYPGGKGIPVFSIKSNPSYQAVMEYVQKSWERIGVSATIDNMDGSTLRELAANGEINLWRASWIADYPDAENYLGLFYTGNIPPNGANRMRYSSSCYDSLFLAAYQSPDDSTRLELYHKMDNLMLEDAPVVLLYYDKILRIISSRVKGLETNAMNMLYLKKVMVEKN